MFVDLTRVHDAPLTNESKQQLGFPFLTGRPWGIDVICRNTRIGPWMHQRLHGSRDVPVIHEKIFFDIERCIATLEIAGMIRLNTMTEDQVLGPCRSANRIRLYKAHLLKSTVECRWSRKISGDRESSQVVNV